MQNKFPQFVLSPYLFNLYAIYNLNEALQNHRDTIFALKRL